MLPLATSQLPRSAGLVLCWFMVAGDLALGQTEEEKKNIVARWEGQRSNVVTARIKYVLVRTGGDLAPVTPERLRGLVESVDFAKGVDEMANITDGLGLGRNKGPWGFTETFIDGQNVREDGLPSNGGPGNSVVVRGGTFADYVPQNKMVKLEAAGTARQYVRGLHDFRLVPAPKAMTFPLIGRAGKRWILGNADGELVIDPPTGEAHRHTWLDNGVVTRDYLQGHFVNYPGDVVFPTLFVEADYVEGKLAWISASYVVEAEFNIDLPAHTFSIPVPGGTNLIEERPDARTLSMKFTEPASDAVKSAEETFNSSDRPETPHRSYLVIALFAAAAVLAAVAFLARLRHRRKKQ